MVVGEGTQGRDGARVRKLGRAMDRFIILAAVIVSWLYACVKIIKLYP